MVTVADVRLMLKGKTVTAVVKDAPTDEKPALGVDELTGFSEAVITSLDESGFYTVQSVADAEIDQLTAISGIGEKTAVKLIAAAKELL